MTNTKTKDKTVEQIEKNTPENGNDLTTKTNNADQEEANKKKQKEIQEAIKKSTIEVEVPDLSQDFIKSINLTLDKLSKLKSEIETKKNLTLEKQDIINNKLNSISNTGAIKTDAEYEKKAEERISRYIQYLDYSINRINEDIYFCEKLTSDKPNEKILVLKQFLEVLTIQDYIKENINGMKRNLKKMEKELRIVSSRYLFEIEEQIKKISYLDFYIKKGKTK